MQNDPKIGNFLTKLSQNATLLEEYFEDPEAVLTNEGLTEEQQEIVLSDKPADLLKALQLEYPGFGLEQQAWRPIRFPLPFPRPIRRVDS